MTPEYIYGMHDPGGEHLFADRKGWITFTEAIGCDPNDKSGRDYRQWSDVGYGVLVRLNNGYGSTGTIPTPNQYGNFAWRVAHYVAASKGADTWIIGNEPNHSNERPDGQPITPEMYIDCFKQVHAAVRDHAGTKHGLIPAPVALWNVETGDWLEYQERIWKALWRLSAGFALHTYTHGASPALITAMERMHPPFADRFYHFMAYRQLMIRVPQEARGLPAFITETDQNDPWVDANTGWVQAAYDEIDRWNATDGTQKIHCLCLYRWPKADQWSIVDKTGVHADFRAAVAKGYTSPPISAQSQPKQETHLTPAQSTLPERQWDERLTQRGVTIETPTVAPGQQFWRIVKAQWWNEQESQGRHHIYVEAPANTPFWALGEGSETKGDTNGKTGFDAANAPMWASEGKNGYDVWINDGKPSESLEGVGMGADTPGGFNAGVHTSTGVTFELATMPATTTPTQPTPEPKPQPPDKPTPMPTGILDPRVLQAILNIESGARTHGENGKPIIRFEAHIFKTKLGNDALWAEFFRADATKPWTNQEWRQFTGDAWKPIHTGQQADEYKAFDFARTLNEEAAMQSISMGAGQIMGFNHARIGYSTAAAMFKAFQSAPVQTIGFINFFLGDAKLVEAMRKKDWRRIAALYNGSGAVDTYAPLLQKAYEALA